MMPNNPEMGSVGPERAQTHGEGARRKAEGRCRMTAPSLPSQGQDEAMHPCCLCLVFSRAGACMLGSQQVYVSVTTCSCNPGPGGWERNKPVLLQDPLTAFSVRLLPHSSVRSHPTAPALTAFLGWSHDLPQNTQCWDSPEGHGNVRPAASHFLPPARRPAGAENKLSRLAQHQPPTAPAPQEVHGSEFLSPPTRCEAAQRRRSWKSRRIQCTRHRGKDQ